MRAKYAAKESALERHVYEVRDGFKPDYSEFVEFEALPSELPRLGHYIDYVYIMNLDREVLTMNYVHWKLGNIPRQDEQWLRAIADDNFPEEYMTTPAVDSSEPKWETKYDFHFVAPKTDIGQPRKAFLTYVLRKMLMEYTKEMIGFGKEWSGNSFIFREFTFALVSIASGQASFYSFPARECDPRRCESWGCNAKHLRKTPGWLGKEWAGDSAPLLEFGTPSHRPGEPPGASPTDAMYWHENVLVNPALVVDGEAIAKAVTWGVEQGHSNFQILVLSLYEAAFAEVSFKNGVGLFVEVSGAIPLKYLRPKWCVSERPEKPGKHRCGQEYASGDTKGTGLEALVNFFEVAANRRAASKSASILPVELYDRIVDFVDYDTWKTCLRVSALRDCCLRKYRLDDWMRIVAGPFKERCSPSFDFENVQTGKTARMKEASHHSPMGEYNWMPVIGSDQKVLMLDVSIQFESAEDVPVEAQSDDESG